MADELNNQEKIQLIKALCKLIVDNLSFNIEHGISVTKFYNVDLNRKNYNNFVSTKWFKADNE